MAEKLEREGKMTDYGRRKIEQAKKNGQWDVSKPPAVTEKQIASLSELLKEFKPAYVATFCLCLYRLKKTYTRAYFDAKTEAGRTKRLS